MKKILLIFPKLEQSKPFHHLPITALAVSAELLAQGHEVKIWDDRVNDVKSGDYKDFVYDADEIMLSCFTGYQLSEGYQFAKDIKAVFPEKRITLGGPHATALPEQTLESPYIDEVIQGEIDTGKYQLPFWLIDIHRYINPATERFIYVSSYGCVGICTFCSTKKRRKLKFLPFERIEKDIDYLMSHYPYKECIFFDATIFTKTDRAHRLSMIMRRYNLSWISDARADEIVKMSQGSLNSKILNDIMHSGLTQLTIGLESGSEDIVKLMKKGNNHLEKYKQCAEIMAKYPNVKMVSGVIFGCPSETIENLLETIEYIKMIKKINPNFFISTTFFRPLPDTEMADMAKEFGYMEPQSLSEWAEQGETNHYDYNKFQDAPWIQNIEEYRAIYEQFRSENKELFV